MDMGKNTSEKLGGWSDMVSMILLGFALLVGDLTPKRPIWGRSRKHIVAMTAAILGLLIWTGFRFIYEGINTQGPREFLAGSVVYLARWLYLMLRLSHPNFKEARRFQVARVLLKVQNLRVGNSNDGPRHTANSDEQNARRRNYGRDAITGESRVRNRGDWEVVLRKGVKRATDRTRHYWRGFIDPEPVWYPEVQAWDVSLLEEGMHQDKLDIFGTTALMNDFEATEKAYAQFYKIILTAVSAPDPPANGSAPSQGNSSTVTEEAGPTSTAPVRQTKLTEQPGSASVGEGANAMAPQSFAISLPEEGSTAQSVHPVGPGHLVGDAQQLSPEQQQQREIPKSERPDPVVNFGKFTRQWKGLRPEFLANSVNATDMREIGFVARRVAADAVAYVNNHKYEFRIPAQVACVNECLDDARKEQFSTFDVTLSSGEK